VQILLCGHYTHDLLVSPSGQHEELGGSSAYASAVFDALHVEHGVVAYAGADFRYADRVRHAPRILQGARTTSFVDDYTGGERVATLLAAAPPIDPADLRERCEIAIACGVAGEVGSAVLDRLRELADMVLVDAQSVVRGFDAHARVVHRAPPADLVRALRRAEWIKGSRDELAALPAAHLDWGTIRDRAAPVGCGATSAAAPLESGRHPSRDGSPLTHHLADHLDCGLIATDGARGCTVVHGGAATHVPAFPARQIDATGAGDCLLAGFAAGLLRGWDPARAARFGAYCGALAVAQRGVPRLTRAQLEAFPG
jgi:1D-myo-inositol 3-kinase